MEEILRNIDNSCTAFDLAYGLTLERFERGLDIQMFYLESSFQEYDKWSQKSKDMGQEAYERVFLAALEHDKVKLKYNIEYK